MAILPMKKISIFCHKSQQRKLLDNLQSFGVVEILPVDLQDHLMSDDRSFAINMIDREIAQVKSAIEVLTPYLKEKNGLFQGRQCIEKESLLEIYQQRQQLYKDIQQINTLSKEADGYQSAIAKCHAQISALSVWEGFDLPLGFKGTKTCIAFIGVLPSSVLAEAFCADFEEEISGSVWIISKNTEQSCIFALAHKEYVVKAEELLRKNGFSRPGLVHFNRTAPMEIASLQKQIDQHLEKMQNAKDAFAEYASTMMAELRLFCDHLLVRRDRYEAFNYCGDTRTCFALSGWVPARSAPALQEHLQSEFSCHVNITDPSEDEEIPVLFDNNQFVSPVESVTEMYSMPSRKDVDPNPVMAIFYYVFFGMMLSDAAYGVIMVIGTSLLLRRKNLESSMKKFLTMFLYCGISTILWGTLFGSWFGNFATIVSQTFFGGSFVIAPMWFDPVNNPMKLLIFSFILGLIHIFTGMAVQFYKLTRQGKFLDAVFDVGFWFMVIIGLLLLIPGGQIALAGKYIAILGSIGLVLTQGRDQTNIFMKLSSGLLSLYNITAYLSDVLSYSRLLALGLATGVVGTVVNTMGALAGGGVIGAIVLSIVFVLGHTMNIGINMLGAFVHTNRLQYVEFFSKFYEGGGKAFKPFAIHTKYFRMKEDI